MDSLDLCTAGEMKSKPDFQRFRRFEGTEEPFTAKVNVPPGFWRISGPTAWRQKLDLAAVADLGKQIRIVQQFPPRWRTVEFGLPLGQPLVPRIQRPLFGLLT